MTTAAVLIQNVNKQFPSRAGEAPVMAVENINLEIQNGEFFSMLGPSGCGKTTTLRMIAGFEDPTSGQIFIQGQDVTGIPPFHRPVNTVFQDYALFPHMTVAQNVGFGLQMEGLKKAEIDERVRDMLRLVELPGMDRRYPKQLSGGQQQRVALARALVKRPKVLLLDEPLGALDLKLRKQMQLELKHMQRQLGITFIYVTHDQEEALTMSDRIAVMSKGHVLQVGPASEIYDSPANRFVADFIGETNFLNGTVVDAATDRATVKVGDQWVLENIGHKSPVAPNNQVTVAIRPEKVALRAASTNGTNSIPGTVEEQIYIGTDTRYVVRLQDGQSIVARVQNDIEHQPNKFPVGEMVKVFCSPDYTLVLAD
jgi:spermidine/putrescine transport system ATP-binding protein